jgi:hypothetical protein
MDNMNSITQTHAAPSSSVAIACQTDTIPGELKNRDQWVGWKIVNREGKANKLPVNVKTGDPASSTDPATWSPFASVVHGSSGVAAFSDLAGVGFVFTEKDPYVGIDLDDCVVDGVLSADARAIVDAFATYTEISPSGTGLKLIGRGTKAAWARCKSSKIEGIKAVEIYDQKRFFTLTGNRVERTPNQIADVQQPLDDLCERLWPQRNQPTSADRPQVPSPLPDDIDLVEKMFQATNGAAIRALWDGNTSAYGGDESSADQALCNHLAFWTGRDPTRIDRLFRQSGLFREKWDRQDYRDGTINNAIAGCTDTYTGPRPAPANHFSPSTKSIPGPSRHTERDEAIFLGVDEHRAIAQTINALSADPDLYQRGTLLVRVMHDRSPRDGMHRPEGSGVIAQVPTANLRDRMTRYARFEKLTNGSVVPAHPASWLVAGVEARGEWPGIRNLTAISDAPILRPDGSVWQTRGYDKRTGVLYEPPPGMTVPTIHPEVNEDDADVALHQLLEIVCDFRFESDDHRSAWVASLLTPLARFAFEGPAPLFLADANIRGAGKTLLFLINGIIVMGRQMPVSSYSHDSDEMRKKITAMAIAGDRMVLLDNLDGVFGNDTLDRALTSTRWNDRILGKSEQVDLPLLASWYATGNNVQVAADTTRRIIHVRLDVLEERPEDRTDFKHPDLIGWVKQERGPLLAAALTILSAYIRAGRPKQNLTPFGSFEGWSGLVREALVWLGMPDPCATRVKLVESSDTTADTLTQLIEGFEAIDPFNNGLVISELLNRLYPTDHQFAPRGEAEVRMRAALETLVNCPAGKPPTNRQVGNRLKSFRRRVSDGRMLDFDDGKTNRGKVWRVVRAESFSSGLHAEGVAHA